ncbi:MAG TPA: hypothetical protein VK427_11125 [Kofleriaceae bacterium]|nr:hypothetical protein [Kofleriaceae bacterium]
MRRVCLPLGLLAAACGEDGNFVVELGRLEFHNESARITAPSSAAPGESIRLEVLTYGGGCISYAETKVFLMPDGADVMPYDRTNTTPGQVCTAELSYIAHEAAITFADPGPKLITVHGRRVSSRADEPITIALTLLVE